MTPQVHRSVIVVEEPELGFVVADKPVPVITDDEILIKVKAVTLNPTDYKHLYVKKDLNAGDSVGCDFAGDVVDVGKNAATNGSFKVGDAAAGFIRGGVIESLNGTFQEYVKILPELAWHVPTDVLSYEDASAMGGIALSTAIQALFHRLKLPTPWEPAKEPIPILIWSGATSVGIYAIRLAKLAGLRVATTASPANHAFMKELGAEVVFDYKDPEAPKKIKEWSGGKIVYGLDTISEHGSTKLAAEAFSDAGGTIITLLPVSREGDALARVEPLLIYIYTALEKDSQDYKDMVEWYKRVPDFAKDLKVMPLKHWDGGLDAIPEALQYLRAGKVKAQKISITL